MDEYRLLDPSKEAPPDPKGTPAQESVKTDTDTPIEKQELPYSVEYFEFEDWGQILLTPQLDVNGMKDKIIFIEKYLHDQAKQHSLQVNKDTFFNLLDAVEKSLKMSKFHEKGERIDKIYKVFKIMQKTATNRTKMRNMIMKANEEAEKRKDRSSLERIG